VVGRIPERRRVTAVDGPAAVSRLLDLTGTREAIPFEAST
jgi:hypothetical protein